MDILRQLQTLLDRTRQADFLAPLLLRLYLAPIFWMAGTSDFLAPLLLRLYLAPIFWMAGTSKFNSFEDTAAWFGNSEWGLGLPFPELMTFLAMSTEMAGAIMLLFGFGSLGFYSTHVHHAHRHFFCALGKWLAGNC